MCSFTPRSYSLTEESLSCLQHGSICAFAGLQTTVSDILKIKSDHYKHTGHECFGSRDSRWKYEFSQGWGDGSVSEMLATWEGEPELGCPQYIKGSYRGHIYSPVLSGRRGVWEEESSCDLLPSWWTESVKDPVSDNEVGEGLERWFISQAIYHMNTRTWV